MELDHPLRHHHEISHHVISAQELPHGLKQAAELLRPGLDYFPKGGLGLPTPVPGVFEGGYLGRGPLARLLFEQRTLYDAFELNGGSR